MDNDKLSLDFPTISRALKAFPLPEVDHVVGIAMGGIVPASLIAHQFNRPMSLIEINYRARDNSPRWKNKLGTGKGVHTTTKRCRRRMETQPHPMRYGLL